jgi:hypothetical protein
MSRILITTEQWLPVGSEVRTQKTEAALKCESAEWLPMPKAIGVAT